MYIHICRERYRYRYPHTRVSSCPGLIGVARVNEKRTSDVTRVLKTPGAELYIIFIALLYYNITNTVLLLLLLLLFCHIYRSNFYKKDIMSKYFIYVYTIYYINYIYKPEFL